MILTENLKDGTLTVCLKGEMDHHGAAAVRQDVDELIIRSKPRKAVLVLSDINFCDSSGLGLIMGRYKTAVRVGATLSVMDPSPPVERMIKLAGMDKLIKIERSARA